MPTRTWPPAATAVIAAGSCARPIPAAAHTQPSGNSDRNAASSAGVSGAVGGLPNSRFT